jgi:hypothetical protein
MHHSPSTWFYPPCSAFIPRLPCSRAAVDVFENSGYHHINHTKFVSFGPEVEMNLQWCVNFLGKSCGLLCVNCGKWRKVVGELVYLDWILGLDSIATRKEARWHVTGRCSHSLGNGVCEGRGGAS